MDAINHLACWSQKVYPELCSQLFEETGVDPQLTQSGLLMLDVNDLDQAETWARRFDHQVERVVASGLRTLEPLMAEQKFQSGLYMPTIHQVRNPRILASLRKWLESKGVAIQENQSVSTIWTANNTLRGIKTDQQSIEAKRVVVAGGAWSSLLFERIGFNLEVFPVQGQMLLFKGHPGMIKHIVMHDGFYVIPRQDGHILAGSTVEYRGYDKMTTEEAYAKLREAAVTIVPELAKLPIVKHWAGLRPGSENGVPFIAAVPDIEGLYVNTGHFRNGVVMGPASARLLADIMLERACIVDPFPYDFPALQMKASG